MLSISLNSEDHEDSRTLLVYKHFVPTALYSDSFLGFTDRPILKEMSAEGQSLPRRDESTTTDRRESKPDSERRRADFLQWRDRQIEGSSRQGTAPAPSAT